MAELRINFTVNNASMAWLSVILSEYSKIDWTWNGSYFTRPGKDYKYNLDEVIAEIWVNRYVQNRRKEQSEKEKTNV